jgi:hypothetical protein
MMPTFRTVSVKTGAAMAIAISDMNSLVVIDFRRFRSLGLPFRAAMLLATNLHLTSDVP